MTQMRYMTDIKQHAMRQRTALGKSGQSYLNPKRKNMEESAEALTIISFEIA